MGRRPLGTVKLPQKLSIFALRVIVLAIAHHRWPYQRRWRAAREGGGGRGCRRRCGRGRLDNAGFYGFWMDPNPTPATAMTTTVAPAKPHPSVLTAIKGNKGPKTFGGQEGAVNGAEGSASAVRVSVLLMETGCGVKELAHGSGENSIGFIFCR